MIWWRFVALHVHVFGRPSPNAHFTLFLSNSCKTTSLSTYNRESHMFPCAQHTNFGRSHPPRKIVPKCLFGIPRMNFPECPGSAIFLALLCSLLGKPQISRNSWHFPGEGFCDPQMAFSGEDEVDMLGSGDPAVCWLSTKG